MRILVELTLLEQTLTDATILSSALLDSVRVEEHGQRHALASYATVSVSGSEALSINIFDPAVRSYLTTPLAILY